MAALTVTSASVKLPAGGASELIAGEALTPGQAAYRHTDSKLYVSDANGPGDKQLDYIVLTPALADEKVLAAPPGSEVYMGAGAGTAGKSYYLHTTAGGFCEYSDLAGSGTAVIFAGVLKSGGTTLKFQPFDSGVVL